VGKQARTRRTTGRLKPAASTPTPVAGQRVDRRILGIVGGVATLLVIGLVVAVISAAAVGGGSAGGPPSGTEVFPENDHSHVTGTVNYDRNPPAGGPHNPVPLNCGVYNEQPPSENAVHSLEHGAVWVTYQPTLPAAQVDQLRQLVVSSYVGTQRYVILSPYPNLPDPVVASAWGAQLKLQSVSDPRLAEFIHYYAGGSQGGEPGGECTGGVGTPIE
jgi:hypothetical protein